MIIAVEGCDKVGKTTFIARLREELKRRRIITRVMNFPRYNSSFGRNARELLRNDKFSKDKFRFHLLCAIDHIQAIKEMKEIESSCDILFIDRSSYSFMNYALVSGIDRDLVHRLSEKMFIPRYVLFINKHYNPYYSLEYDSMEKEHIQTAVYNNFQRFYTRYGWKKLDNTDSTDIIRIAKEICIDHRHFHSGRRNSLTAVSVKV